MELRRFISQALQDIIGGVEDAQKAVHHGAVVPFIPRTFQAVEHGINEVQAVDFEVTIRTDERASSGAKLSVVAAAVGGGVKGESGKSGGHAATLRFKILRTAYVRQNEKDAIEQVKRG
jgi:hypothetical protein